MKSIHHAFPWTDKTEWYWPDEDRKLIAVIDDVLDVDAILLQHCEGFNTCFQAGAACGIWPHRLAHSFQSVISVEPLDENFSCAAANLHDVANIRFFQGIIGSGDEKMNVRGVGMRQHPREQNNAGSQQVELHPEKGEKRYMVYTIDELCSKVEQVDFIALDLEGYELHALFGAEQTIERCKPLIMVEDKGLSTKFGFVQGSVVDYLQRHHGYQVAERCKRDVILKYAQS